MIDSEGYISMVERTNGYLARRIAITNCNLPLLVAVGKQFGGKIHVHTPPAVGHKQQFQWYCYGDTLRTILGRTLPWLIAKRQEAKLCLAFDLARKPSQGHHLSAKALTQYRRLIAQVDAIRQRQWTAEDVPPTLRSRRD